MTDETVVPTHDKMSKRELEQHLQNMHGYASRRLKRDSVVLHESLHEGANLHAMGVQHFPDDHSNERMVRHGTHPLRFDHTHVEATPSDSTPPPPVTEDQQERLRRIQAGEPISDHPLSAGERTVLTKLVDNEFAQTKSQMQQFAADALRAKQEEVRLAWQEKVEMSNSYVAKAKRLEAKARKAWEELDANATGQGINLTYNSRYSGKIFKDTQFQASVTGLTEALADAKNENAKMLARALLSLEEQRLKIQSRILMSSLTAETAAFLDTLPSAQQMMIEAQRAQTASEITS